MFSFYYECKMYIKKTLMLMGIKYNYRRFFWGRRWYLDWIEKHEKYFQKDISQAIDSFRLKPLISIIVPVYNVEESILRKCINSVLNQYYENWELCIADDNSSLPHIKRTLEYYETIDKRIKVTYRKENGHISECSNSALELATGDFTALLDNDDMLQPFALYEVVKVINEFPGVDLIYSNEDKLLNDQRIYPFFKKSWNRELLLYVNYISHLAVYRTVKLKKIGGFRTGFEGAQDWDLALRFTEKTSKIIHIPKILYHWRMIETSTSVNQEKKPYVKQAQRKTLIEAKKRKLEG
ncbi:glycosyltransferase family 2 protein [Paenibacillus elgii]|uniref:glycosyltransferase family 2 protein n=1 Tax=Paenibacillus elgii TaxID=189691 RepID=UPI00203F85C9|nr:glycosyltransferase [Paenibacillus elgii]MCM3272395.1 glycosyltransferase [Paenibacillus elgii]